MFISRKKLLNPLAKMLVVMLLAWAIYERVFARENINEMAESISKCFQLPQLFWLFATVLLAPVNLLFETLKFRQLISGFISISIWKTFCSVLAGITVAIFTPNRVGEPGGRALLFEPVHGWKTVIATVVGGLSQLLVLLSAGLTGAIYYFSLLTEPEPFIMAIVACLGFSMAVLLFFIYFNIDLFIPLVKRIPYIHKLRRYLRHLSVLRDYSRPLLGKALIYALLRYLTYSTQYNLILLFFGVDVGWLDGMAAIATIFLIQALVPLPPVAGVLARVEIALFVLGIFSQDKAAIMSSSLTLFVINIVLPALMGLVFIVQTNFLKFFGYDNKDRM